MAKSDRGRVKRGPQPRGQGTTTSRVDSRLRGRSGPRRNSKRQ